MSEYAIKKTRGSFLVAIFAMQGFRILAGVLVSLIVSTAFHKHALDKARYTALVAKNTSKAAADISRILNVHMQESSVKMQSNEAEYRLFSVEFFKRHGLHLLCTSTNWFLLDILLFQKDMLRDVGCTK
ncbi:hypothetical protein SUGI_0879030 [Cryptomeria japonica]|nr:hypothetical protein SUGI_0879030 [Cryptomeria japonica]